MKYFSSDIFLCVGFFLIFFLGFFFIGHTFFNTQEIIIEPQYFHIEKVISEEKKLQILTKNIPEWLEDIPFSYEIEPEEGTFDKTLLVIFRKHTTSYFLKKYIPFLFVHIYLERKFPRGNFKDKTIHISGSLQNTSEFFSVFIHEMGHLVDLYFLTPKKIWTDVSQDFYKINWETETIKKAGSEQKNFVSGYASTNQYEDFAESFCFYILHNKQFEQRAIGNEALQKKYNFFQKNIFTQKEFIQTSFWTEDIPEYIWDSTKIPIQTKKYLKYIQNPL